MKLLHTSDWHLGQSFFTQNRRHEHRQFLTWLLDVVKEHEIDVVVVAGDVFDTAAPPSYARELYNQFVVELQAYPCTLVVLGGNHDSVSVLNESKSLLSCLNVHVIAACAEDESEQLVEVKDVNGRVIGLICAIPFIRPRDVIISEAGQSGDDKKSLLGDAIKQHYARVYHLAAERKAALGGDIPIVATGHLTALGVSQSDSVREIYIGTLDGFSANNFPAADYIALGHIHRPQRVGKREHIRYCGSPIPLSFDELASAKQVMVVSFDGTTPHMTPVAVPRFQAMAVLRGNLSEIEEQLAHIDETAEPIWLCIEVTTEGYLPDLHQRIQGMVENKPVAILQLRRVRAHQGTTLQQQREEHLAELTPDDVFERRLALMPDDTDDALRLRLRAHFQTLMHSLYEEPKGQ
ncbi:exonuclease subunit SbcD [Alteromonas sp. C1M14]|uniref:exonuclease subunit SbcD n=1 Tax=Alteromonas sp. C1M14 TaxID=2841567 RepID=UPI001C08A65A|nr:exonuclease subunit SbcD [Alteromonas sp. C1M14]MBU2977747.1 exonuclease subunit SbcD [Alteromonas sp. C1M14]